MKYFSINNLLRHVFAESRIAVVPRIAHKAAVVRLPYDN